MAWAQLGLRNDSACRRGTACMGSAVVSKGFDINAWTSTSKVQAPWGFSAYKESAVKQLGARPSAVAVVERRSSNPASLQPAGMLSEPVDERAVLAAARRRRALAAPCATHQLWSDSGAETTFVNAPAQGPPSPMPFAMVVKWRGLHSFSRAAAPRGHATRSSTPSSVLSPHCPPQS